MLLSEEIKALVGDRTKSLIGRRIRYTGPVPEAYHDLPPPGLDNALRVTV